MLVFETSNQPRKVDSVFTNPLKYTNVIQVFIHLNDSHSNI